MENLSEGDIEELKIIAKKYFELEKNIEPLKNEIVKIKLDKRKKEQELKDKNDELSIIRDDILNLFDKNNIGTLDTNKGKFKIYTPPAKIIKYKVKEIKENLAKLFTDKLNTTGEQNEELYAQTHQKETIQKPPQLKVLKPKNKNNVFIF